MITASCFQLSTPATLESARVIRSDVADAAVAAGARPRVVEDVRLCVGEAVSNVVVHAYGEEPGTVDVVVERSETELVVSVVDGGRGMREFELLGDLGYGLKIIAKLSKRYVISSAPTSGTRVRMIFSLDASR